MAQKFQKEMAQINKIRNEKEIITNTTEIHRRIVRNYYDQQHAKKLDILGKMDKFLETHKFPKLNQGEPECYIGQ